MRNHLILFTLLGAALAGSPASGHDDHKVPPVLELDALLEIFGWNLDQAEITSQKVADGLYVLFGEGGNIAVSIGSNGVLIVDDQFPSLKSRIDAKIRALGGGKVDFAINTHWHFDHAEGNRAYGPDGTWLVAQANSRAMMLEDHVINLVSFAYDQKAYPAEALPVMTFDQSMQFHFNGERIDLLHFGPAHTTGDTAIIFRGSNAVHLGDVFNLSGYPFIDVDNGGSLDGVISFCEQTLATIDESTTVIPGHGEVGSYQDLKNYIQMLSTIRSRMAPLIARGASLEEVKAEAVSAEFDKQYGDSAMLIDRAYTSMTHATEH